jgi:hypothetical protein
MKSNLDPRTPPDRAGALRSIVSNIHAAEHDLEQFATSALHFGWGEEEQGIYEQYRSVIDGFYELFRGVRDGNRN